VRHFARCVRGKETLQASGEDGRVVLQALYAAYASAGQGQKIKMPYQPRSRKPIDEWLNRASQ
jgi:myo-inositol 2-dehydrogenase / D-chiro-inositol 1-dehydrogenase